MGTRIEEKDEGQGRTVTVRLDAIGAVAALAIVAAVSMVLALGYARQARTYEQALGECRDARIAAQAKVEQFDMWIKAAHPAGGMGGGR